MLEISCVFTYTRLKIKQINKFKKFIKCDSNKQCNFRINMYGYENVFE